MGRCKPFLQTCMKHSAQRPGTEPIEQQLQQAQLVWNTSYVTAAIERGLPDKACGDKAYGGSDEAQAKYDEEADALSALQASSIARVHLYLHMHDTLCGPSKVAQTS